MKKKMIGFMAAGVLVIAAAGYAVAGASAPNVINNTTPSNPGPGAQTVQAADENGNVAEPAESDRFVDLNPIKKWGTIVSVDAENGQIVFNSHEDYVNDEGMSEDVLEEIVFNVADGVPVLDAVTGMPVALEDLKEGDTAYAWTAQMMTMSLPPQTPLQAMIVNIPADYAVPQYVVVKDIVNDGNGNVTITDQDGNRYVANTESTTVTPYLTRQMIYLEGIEKDNKCMIWVGPTVATSYPPQYTAEKIMVFNW